MVTLQVNMRNETKNMYTHITILLLIHWRIEINISHFACLIIVYYIHSINAKKNPNSLYYYYTTTIANKSSSYSSRIFFFSLSLSVFIFGSSQICFHYIWMKLFPGLHVLCFVGIIFFVVLVLEMMVSLFSFPKLKWRHHSLFLHYSCYIICCQTVFCVLIFALWHETQIIFSVCTSVGTRSGPSRTELHDENQYNDLSLLNLVEFVSTE